MTNINTFQGDVFIHEYIKHTGDDNTYFGFSGADAFVVRTHGTDHLTINASGNVVIPVNLTIPNYIFHSGDADTYFGFNGDDSYVVRTGGTDSLSVDASGNMFVRGTVTIPSLIYHNGDANTYFGFSADDTIVLRTAGTTALTISSGTESIFAGPVYVPDYIYHVADSNTYFGFSADDSFVVRTAGVDRINVNNAGNVSIGVNIYLPNYIYHTGDTNTYFGFNANDTFIVTTSGVTGLTVDSAGNLFPRGALYSGGYIYIPDYIFHSGDSNSYFGFVANDQWKLTLGGADRLYVSDVGNVGVGQTSPAPKFAVRVAAGASMGANWGQGDLVVSHFQGTQAPHHSLGVGIGVDYVGNGSASVGYIWSMRPGLTWNRLQLMGSQVLLQATEGNGVKTQGSTVTSDDRLKTDEVLIKNATSTLMKLKPQTYNKNLNLPNSKDETKVENSGIPYSKSYKESGLIVQDLYYDAPELRHMINLAADATPRETKPEEPVPGDIQQDPDYSDWGCESSSLNYVSLIPYLIQSVKEINTDAHRHKTKITGIPFSNISEYHNLIVSKDIDVCLSNIYNDRSVYGVISETETSTDDSEVLVNYNGDGKVWVINTSNIESGDYITTSNIGGYGMKQDTDFKMNYTLAKSAITCDFTQGIINEKRRIQELQDVKYWTITTNPDITKTRYDFLASNNTNLVTTSTNIIYSNVTIEESSGNTIYSNLTTSEYLDLSSDILRNNYTEVVDTSYHIVSTREYSLNPNNTTSNVVIRQEYVDVLDENGQIQWENTGNTIPLYELRFIDSNGSTTDEANATHKAALIECTYQLG